MDSVFISGRVRKITGGLRLRRQCLFCLQDLCGVSLIYSLSELIAHSYPLTDDISLKEIVKEAALFAVELTEGVNLVIDDIKNVNTLH